MKTEAAAHAHAAHAVHHAHRPTANATSAADPTSNDPFAQLLAGLFVDESGGAAADGTDTAPDTKAEALPKDDAAGVAVSLSHTANDQAATLAENPLAAVLAANLVTTRDGQRAEAEAALPSQAPTPEVTAATPMAWTPPVRFSQASTPEVTAATGDGSQPHGNLLAGLSAEGGLGHVVVPAADGGVVASPFVPWISTFARAKQRLSAVARATAGEGASASPAAEDSRVRGDAAGHRGTDATRLDALLTSASPAAAQPPAGTGPSGEPAATDRREAARATDGPTTGSPGIGDPGSSPPSPEGREPADFGLQLDSALADTFEAIGAQITLWASGKTQRASFSVREGLDEPLAVDVTLNDGVAQLSFRTDDAALRQVIQAQAPTALADALARAGLALGSMEVGGQSAQGQSRDSGTPAVARTLRMGLTAPTGADTVGAGASARLPRDRSGIGLDVYA